MEYDFAHPELFVFKFKCFEYYGQAEQKKTDEPQSSHTAEFSETLDGTNEENDLQINQLHSYEPTNPLDAQLTLFCLIDNDSPRKLQTAFELYELQNSIQEVAIVLCFKSVSKSELRRFCKDAPFLHKMNLVLDLGNAESFLKNNECAFYTFTEDEEEIFADYNEMFDYLRTKFAYEPVHVEDRVLYKNLSSGNKVVINGICNPVVNEAVTYDSQTKFFAFYFKENIDNLNYLFNEIVQLQDGNADCYFVVALNPR